ncbi:DNase I-like protein, partial [Lentinus brumalis]
MKSATTNPQTNNLINQTDVSSVSITQRLSDTGAVESLAAAREREESVAEHGSSPRADEERVEHPLPQTNASGRNRPSKSPGQRTRATLSIGTLNMRGAGQATHGGIGDKWMRVNQVLRDGRIGILGIQEAHLIETKADQLNTLFSMSMKVFTTADPENPTGARGVAIALNKRLVDTDSAECTRLIPGRAMSIKIKWSREKYLTILVIYAPNDPSDNAEFWPSLLTAIRARNGLRPNIILGDFNVVETAADRMPARSDPERPVNALREFCQAMSVRDEWRCRHPAEIEFTYAQTATGSQSRIDRVYLDKWMQANAVEWKVEGPGLTTDHQLVLCTLTNRDKPYIGKGRWRMHAMLLEDRDFLKDIRAIGLKLQTKLRDGRPRTEANNPQILYADFKEAVRELAKAHAKSKVPKIAKEIDKLRADLKESNKKAISTVLSEAQTKHALQESAILQERITDLEVKRFGSKRAAVAARDWLEGETISKYWMRLNKT